MPKITKEVDDYIEQLGDMSVDEDMKHLKEKWPHYNPKEGCLNYLAKVGNPQAIKCLKELKRNA